MAFLDFSQPLAGAPTTIAAARAEGEDAIGFDAREWRIIRFAQNDSLRSLREPGRLDRLSGLLFGRKQNPRLADSRLEALRQLAVEAWHRGYAVPVSAIKAFRAEGFSIAQLELLMASIGATRDARGRRAAA
ncbi:hypothetical protein [Flavisphingomonas formosensis]|uniref:hypothetical protein n=1 Tax=Flavisphingomonas formosensis TaxID=861534 RepID=UPI0012FBD581|nr:hypothetical protein [Sphingomonas formosensis]